MNPFASGVDEHRVAAVSAALPALTETRITHRRGEATEIAASVAAEVDTIYVFGGDGTYNEVLNGAPRGVTLGFVPGGGTSVLLGPSGSRATPSRPRSDSRMARAARSRSVGSTGAGSGSARESASTPSSCARSTGSVAAPRGVAPATARSPA